MSSLFAQDRQEIVLTLEEISVSDKLAHFNKGEAFRYNFKFREAVQEYEKVLSLGEISGKESEAHYNIGLCYTWTQDFQEARQIFAEVKKTHANDNTATAFAEYGLAWVDTREGKYLDAIDRLQQRLKDKPGADKEYNAVMRFHIGRVYLKHLKDYDKAKDEFRKVAATYPNSEIAKHPYMKLIKD